MIKDIKEILIEKLNNRPIDDFFGLSPEQMHFLLYETFSENSVIGIKETIGDEILSQISLLNQVKYFLKMLIREREIKLTPKGYLPRKFVIELYEQKFITDYLVEIGISKMSREMDVTSILLTRILCELSGLCKKRNNKLSITQRGMTLIDKDYNLLALLFGTFSKELNWGYFDAYADKGEIQLGVGYSLFLLLKFGEEQREISFYADNFLKAMPHGLMVFEGSHEDKFRSFNNFYALRVFQRFLVYFNFVEITQEDFNSTKYVKCTPVFDKILELKIK